MIPDTLLEYILWLTIKSTVKDSVFPKFCDRRKPLLLYRIQKSCNEIASLMSLLVCNVMISKLNGIRSDSFNRSSIEFCQKHSIVKLHQQQCQVFHNFSLFMQFDV